MSNAGHECVGACEIDDHAGKVYAEHFPDTPVWRDVRRLDPKALPDFDCLTAGFPCQAFSSAGFRLGFKELRGTVFFEIARIARQKRPRLMLLENVKGLLNHEAGRTFEIILRTLDECGYDAQWQVLNSKYFIPQNRERVFIVCHLRGTPRPEVFPVTAGSAVPGESIEGTKPGLPAYGHADTDRPYVVSRGYGNQRRGFADHIETLTASHIHDIGIMRLSKSKFGSDGVVDSRGVHKTLRAYQSSYPVYVGNDAGRARMINMHRKHMPMSKRIQDRAEAWTLVTDYKEHGVVDLHGKIRRLTEEECEALQGLPRGWTDCVSMTHRYKCIGNAVTVPVIEFIARRLQ